MKIYIENAIQKNVEWICARVLTQWDGLLDNVSMERVENVKALPHNICKWTDAKGSVWSIIMPTTAGTVFFLDYFQHADEIKRYAGGEINAQDLPTAGDDLISIVAFGDENESTLELRFVHELLHGLKLPADDMNKYEDGTFLSVWDLLGLALLKYFRIDTLEYRQRRFYRWILKNAKQGEEVKDICYSK